MAIELFDHVHVPGTSDRTLVLLHGAGDNKERMAELGRRIDPEASVLALDGQVMQDGARRFFRRQSMGLYDMADLAARSRGLVAFLADAFDRYEIRPERTVAIGYSNGASILTNLILTGCSPVTSAVLMHPLIPFMVEKWPDLSAQKLLVTSGILDAECPAPWIEKLADGLREAGAEVLLKMHRGGHELAEEEIDWARGYIC